MWPAKTPVWLRVLVLLTVGISAVLAASGQSQNAPAPKSTTSQQDEQEIDPDDVISVSTTEVLLPVTVRDHSGRLVTDLTRKSFRVFEDGVEQPLSDLS